jgi:D-alanyl-D-alanine carboxypeptidase
MAENISETQRQLSEAMAAVQRDLALFGQVTRETAQQRQDAEMKAKYGINNFTAGTASAAKSLEALGGAGMAAGKAMLEGKKGAAAFNSSLDGLTTAVQAAGAALALLVPVIGPLIAIVTAAGVALIKYGKAANEMADKLYNGYRGLAQSGAAAADGMTGLKVGAQKLSLTMDELSDYVQLVAENSQDLANFGGTVYKGRQAFENLGKALEPAQKGFLAMGLMPKDIAEGMAGYMRTQTRLGNAQRMSTEQLAAGVRGYLIEQDALTKLTGVNRKEAEKMREDALMEEQHAGMIRKLQLEGRPDEAKNMIAVSDAANRLSPELGKMVRALQTGNLSNEQARKLMISAPGAMRALEMGTKGALKPMEVMDQVVKELAATGDNIGTGLAPLGAFNQTFVDMGLIQNLRIKQEKGLQQTLDETEEELKRQGATGKKAADQLVENQTNLIKVQIDANKVMTDFIFKGIAPAQTAMIDLAKATAKAGNLLDQLTPGGKSTEKKTGEMAGAITGALSGALAGVKLGALAGSAFGGVGAVPGALIGATVGAFGGAYLGKEVGGGLVGNGATQPEARAVGGPVSKSTPYLVGEDGPEIFVPKAAGDIVSNNRLSTGAAVGDNFSAAIDGMYKDVKTQEKTLDVDTVRQKQFSDLQKRYFDTYGGFMKDVIEQVDNNDPKDSSSSIGRMFSGLFGGSTGLQMPAGAGMTSMGGAQGMQGPESHSAVGGGGQGINAPKLASVRSKTGKSAEVNAEYAPRFQSLIDYLDSIGYEINSLGGYVDRDVRGKPGVKSVHAKGGAIDINPGSNPMGGQLMTDLPENISAIAKGLGLGWGGNWAAIKDAMHFSVAANEGGDIKLSDGGVAVGPNSGYRATLHGEEAVIPLNNGGGNFVKLFESMADSNIRMVGMLEELVRAQKSGNDISSKMLRMQT